MGIGFYFSSTRKITIVTKKYGKIVLYKKELKKKRVGSRAKDVTVSLLRPRTNLSGSLKIPLMSEVFSHKWYPISIPPAFYFTKLGAK